MGFRLFGSDLTVIFVETGSCDSSLSDSSDSGGRGDDDEAVQVAVFWWLCCRYAVWFTTVVNVVRRGGAALACVVMATMCWLDAAVEFAVRYVWAGCKVTSFKWCNVRSFVASVCGSAVAIVSTVFGGVVMAPACGDGSAFQESAFGAALGAGPCASVTTQAGQRGQEFEPDTIVSGNVSEHSEPDTCVSGGNQMYLGEVVAVLTQSAMDIDEQFVWGARESTMYFDLATCTYK